MKDLECENEKLQSKVKNLQKKLVKTGTVEEQVITEIVTRENMKNEYNAIINSMKEKEQLMIKEKEENQLYYEKKIDSLHEHSKKLEDTIKKKDDEIKTWKGRNKL